MCNQGCLDFVSSALTRRDVRRRRVLEVGAYDVNGSARSIISNLNPLSYLGVDISDGPGVDRICDASHLIDEFGVASFDVVISTEMIEHVADWQLVIHNMKQVLSPDGVLLITTRSEGFPLHDYPADHWRFSADDMRVIFADCIIDHLELDQPEDPGVFIKVHKPKHFRELNLDAYALYSMIEQKRALRPTTD